MLTALVEVLLVEQMRLLLALLLVLLGLLLPLLPPPLLLSPVCMPFPDLLSSAASAAAASAATARRWSLSFRSHRLRMDDGTRSSREALLAQVTLSLIIKCKQMPTGRAPSSHRHGQSDRTWNTRPQDPCGPFPARAMGEGNDMYQKALHRVSEYSGKHQCYEGPLTAHLAAWDSGFFSTPSNCTTTLA